MKPKSNHGLQRLIKATGYSIKGLKAAFENEAAFREEVVLCVLLLPIVFIIDITMVERVLLILALILVLMAELTNSAIEAVVDRIGSEIHPLSGRAKDIGSALVFVALIFCGLTWAMILLSLL